MTSRITPLIAAAALAAAGLATITTTAAAAPPDRPDEVRFSTFNASLNRGAAGQLLTDLASGTNQQAANVAETIQRANPDVVLVNEFDYEPDGAAAELFRSNYLEKSWNGSTPVDYPYYYVAPSNTGIPTGFDLNNNGVVGTPGTQAGGDDSFGFGLYPGQFGMAVFSKYPILTDDVRTFQHFLWKDMPGALLPNDPAVPGEADWYSPEELDGFRLSSKSHWDVPIKLPGRKPVHFLVSHPTPPTFDGAEDRNGTRNHDEIRLWADYVTGGSAAAYIYDDEGKYGGLGKGQDFVIAGDQNADPYDGDSVDDAIWQFLDHPRINASSPPESAGAVQAAALQGGANLTHTGPHAQDTADFNDNAPGNLRADYVLPSSRLEILDSAVFWPVTTDPLYRLTGAFPFPTSDHRLVWVDVAIGR
jgi:hypothetical protein